MFVFLVVVFAVNTNVSADQISCDSHDKSFEKAKCIATGVDKLLNKNIKAIIENTENTENTDAIASELQRLRQLDVSNDDNKKTAISTKVNLEAFISYRESLQRLAKEKKFTLMYLQLKQLSEIYDSKQFLFGDKGSIKQLFESISKTLINLAKTNHVKFKKLVAFDERNSFIYYVETNNFEEGTANAVVVTLDMSLERIIDVRNEKLPRKSSPKDQLTTSLKPLEKNEPDDGFNVWIVAFIDRTELTGSVDKVSKKQAKYFKSKVRKLKELVSGYKSIKSITIIQCNKVNVTDDQGAGASFISNNVATNIKSSAQPAKSLTVLQKEQITQNSEFWNKCNKQSPYHNAIVYESVNKEQTTRLAFNVEGFKPKTQTGSELIWE